MDEIISNIKLDDWLAGQPQEVSVVIASRNALRVLPLVVRGIEDHSVDIAAAILPIFRGNAPPWFKGTWPHLSRDARTGAAAADAATAAADRAGATRDAADATRAADDVAAEAYYAAARAAAATYAAAAATYAVGRAANVDATRATSAAADAAAATADAAAASADARDSIWREVSSDVEIIETGQQNDDLSGLPLWNHGFPDWFKSQWDTLRTELLRLDANWSVWIDWYEDRLQGAAGGRPLIMELELRRILIPNSEWAKGPERVNAIIAELEAEFRAIPPPQRAAIIEVEYGSDGLLHKRPSIPPEARDPQQGLRLRDAWTAHRQHLESLKELDPGRNSPALRRAVVDYDNALGTSFDELKVIALGMHGDRLAAFAERADILLMEDAAAELKSLSAVHGVFIRQFDEWLTYLEDASPIPSRDSTILAIQVVRSTADAGDIIATDVSIPLNQIADAAEPPADPTSENTPPESVSRELLRSLGNVLSGMLMPLVTYARDLGSNMREGTLEGAKEFAKKATLALAFGGTSYVAALAVGLPGEFGWIIPVLALLKTKLGK